MLRIQRLQFVNLTDPISHYCLMSQCTFFNGVAYISEIILL